MGRRPPTFVSATLLAALAGLALGCHDDAASPYFGTTIRRGKSPRTFYVNNSGEPEYLDPGKAADGLSSAIVMQLFEGLTAYHPVDMHPVQGVATHWEQSADNRYYRFHLRPEARWSDGKPVTAGDFEYAWKRVLRPATAARAAANLYPLVNGELFSSGKLRVLAREGRLAQAPRADAAAGAPLPKGTALRILGHSPRKVTSAVPVLPAVPASVPRVSTSRADAKKGTSEQLSLGAQRPAIAAAGDGAWKNAKVEVLEAGPAVDCDGNADRWFLVQRGSERGYLPGCLLGDAKLEAGEIRFALVEKHERLPTFKPQPAAEPPSPRPEPVRGFVDESLLVEDDAVVGVRAADEHTLEVELGDPAPYFTDLTSSVTLAPVRRDVVEAFEKRGEAELWVRPENIVTNGPFTLDEWKFRYEISLKQNPHWWAREKLGLDRVVMLEIEDYHSTMNLYKAGEIDFIGDNLSLPAEYQPILKTKKDYRNNPYLSIYWYELNTKKPPLDDVRVRRALNLALDKKQLVTSVTRGGQFPATHYVPDFTGLGYAEQVEADRAAGTDPFASPELAFNPERARALLKEAGYEVVKEGDSYRAVNLPAIEILYNTSEGHKMIAVALQDMWKRNLGVSVTLRNEEWKVMLKNYRDGYFQVMRFGWTADYNHAHTFLDQFLSQSPANNTGWTDPAFDEAVRRAAAEPDRKESIKLYRKAEEIAVAAMPRIPLYFYTKSTLVKPWVKGFWGWSRNAHLYQYLWIDQDFEAHPDNRPAYSPLELPPPGVLSP
jgi:oligopeptide transport system substrate-binding protein